MALNIVEKIDNFVKINNIIVSVSDKIGLEQFLKKILTINPELKIYSTGGTFKFISSIPEFTEKQNLIQISDYTGQAEMQGGLVKTLDFRIYTGILSEKYNEIHQDDLAKTNSISFDMVIANLYPFADTVKNLIEEDEKGAEKARANIDIGGPCMLRSSAKNYHRVASVCMPSSYAVLAEEIETNNGALSLETRFKLACSTFSHTAEYDSAISSYLASLKMEKINKCYTIL